MEQQKQAPLTPQSVCDGPSPLDALCNEIAELKKSQQFKTDQRVLDQALKLRNYRDFLKQRNLLGEFNTQYPY
jgi:hypothetical protein